MTSSHPACPACGARVAAGSDRCELCGSRLDAGEASAILDARLEDAGPVDIRTTLDSHDPVTADEQAPPPVDTDDVALPHCSSCGCRNPAGARFCGGCGAVLSDHTSEAPVATGAPAPNRAAGAAALPVTERKTEAATRPGAARQNVWLVIASAVLLVAAMFVITEVSGDRSARGNRAASDPAIMPQADPIAEDLVADVEEIKAEISSLAGPDRLAKRRELVDVYSRAGRLDLAGPVQEEIAAELNTEAEWIRAGNAYYDWMESETGSPRTYFARKAIAAYQRALGINPDNHDVRTDMAIAYLYDPENTMQAILNTNMVLEEDSNHVQANFNRGIMLLQIGRFEQAKAQLRKVMRLVGDPQAAVYQRAEAALSRLGEE